VDIKALPHGTRCLVDANILIYFLGGVSLESRDFLLRVAGEEVEAWVTTTVIAEVAHRRMLTEVVGKGLVSAGKVLAKLKARPTLITRLTDHVAEVVRLLSLPIRVAEVEAGDIAGSHALRLTHGLFVNDSINLACAQRLGINDVVSHDADFNRVPGLTIWEPTDV
jgi:predicted nucleic acid-binding protein